MDIITLIKKTKSDLILKPIAKLAIKKAMRLSRQDNDPTTFIGTGAQINPNISFENEPYLMYDCFRGFIPKGTRIVYSTIFDGLKHTYANCGYYYYVDDESYIIDFFRFLRKRTINDDYDIFIALNDFLYDYFGKFYSSNNRHTLHGLLLKNDDIYFPPLKEHSIKDFRGNGSALCSEFALLAQNILSVLGYDIIYMMSSTHAYNIIVYDADDEYRATIIDFSAGVKVMDHNLAGNKMHPFIEEIPNAGDDILSQFVNDGREIVFNDYFLQDINGTLFKHYTDRIRIYGLMNNQISELEASFDLKKQK